MKKTVVIMIGVIYVIAIAVVAFLGVNFKTFDPVYYIRSVEIVVEESQIHEGKTQVVIYLDENGKAEYQLKARFATSADLDEDAELTMRDADFEKVEFQYDRQKTFVSISEDGLVTFTKKGQVTITILPKDGSDCSDTVTITVKG